MYDVLHVDEARTLLHTSPNGIVPANRSKRYIFARTDGACLMAVIRAVIVLLSVSLVSTRPIWLVFKNNFFFSTKQRA